MTTLIVVNDPSKWPFDIPDVEIVEARRYLTDPYYSELRLAKVFNLCRSYRYQATGYYVSLLAEARGHKPQPSVETIQGMKSHDMIRLVSNELDKLIQTSLARISSSQFTLSIYFGRNLAKRYDRLSMHLYNMFQSPLLRAQFVKSNDRWSLKSVSTISASDVSATHADFVTRVAAEHFAGRRARIRRKTQARYDLAILYDPNEPEPPSNEKALARFAKAADQLAIRTELITEDDFARISEFDALFIRQTTAVNDHTYRFAQQAANKGLIVIDDPLSILRCTNKVYLAELLSRCKIATPKTMVVHRGNVDQLVEQLGLPVVLKKPDSAFSKGVTKVEDKRTLNDELKRMFDESDLVVAQEFLPTTFDWRIGILDQRPLYACKYHMAPNHWQIIQQEQDGSDRYGRVEALPVELAPRKAVSIALKAANLIGNGLYGVDVKQSGDQFYVIEVNDNPTIDGGHEDKILREELYRRIMELFLTRIELSKQGTRS